MARITATGTPVKYPELGEIRITVTGDEVNIDKVRFESRRDRYWEEDPAIDNFFRKDLRRGPRYPLCAEPFTMTCALFVLLEWFGEADSCWTEEPKHVILEGEVEPMESEPGRIY